MKRATARYAYMADLASIGTNHIGEMSPYSPITASSRVAVSSVSIAAGKSPANQSSIPKPARFCGR